MISPDTSVAPVCIAGMHRSGTSMVAKLLHGCGLYLGEAADLAEPGTHNPDGYWENLRFVEINDELLNGAGGGWDQVPPELATGAGNQRRDHHRRLRARAKALLGRFPQGAPWGWKDPRNSLTFPFWDDLCPGLRTVMCVRNPLEVALSLRRRNDFSYAHGLTLWAEYNRRLLESSSRERRLVTHYDAFFRDPEAEVRRLAEFAGLSPPEEVVRSTVAAVRSELRHNRFSAADLLDARVAGDLLELYARLCEEAGWREPALAERGATRAVKVRRSRAAAETPTDARVDHRVVDAELMRRELNVLRPELRRLGALVQDLETRLGETTGRAAQLDEALAQARAELARARDQAAAHLAAELHDLRLRLDFAERRAEAADAMAAKLAAAAEAAGEADYRRMIRQLRDVVRAVVPSDATVLVVSRGDGEVLRLDGRVAWHFPRSPDGTYAGHYPADSAEAIGHLESLRRQGADYLVVPDAALWWLDHYCDLRLHLETRCRAVARVDGACRVFALAPVETSWDAAEPAAAQPEAHSRTDYHRLVNRIRSVADKTLPRHAVVAVISKGDDELLRLNGRRGSHFPQADDGAYLGYHPADSAGAVTHLEALRSRGVQYLLVPATAFWWLDHYAAFRDHIDSHYSRIWGDDGCVIYRLDGASDGRAARSEGKSKGVNGSPLVVPAAVTVPSVQVPAAAPVAGRRALVDVIVCVHNALEDVRQCLESVVGHTSQPYSLIVVDDGSDGPTRDFLAAFCKAHAATILRSDKGSGYTFAANRGLRRSRADYALLLNSDTVVTPGWLDRMVACAESDERIGLVGPLSNTASWQSVPDLSQGADWAGNALPEGTTPEQMAERVARASGRICPRLPFLNGFCLMIRRAVIEQVGYFDEENFGRGYGEENDYCIRARAAGCELAVADDAYVLHRQSRSYSNERRRQLCEQATKALVRKHGADLVQQGSDACRHSRVMHGVRARVRVAGERERLAREARSRWGGRRVLYLLPSRGPNGGCNVVLQEAAAMRAMGVDARVLNLQANRAEFEANYPDNPVPLVYVATEARVPEALADYDAAVATINASVEWLQPRGGRGGGRKRVRAYYVQDFEPYFYVPGSEAYQVAWESYTRFGDLVRLTKTEWNRAVVKEQRGVDCRVVGPSVDIDLYRPRPGQCDAEDRPVRVAAMVRPSTPRRSPRLTMEVLRDLRRARGDQVEIVVFGCRPDDPDLLGLPCDFPWRCAGVLGRRQAASLLNDVDVFADFSSFQAMGLTALEAMACGAAVIVPRAGGSDSFARHEHNALVVDTTSAAACLAVLDRLAGEAVLRDRLRWQAISDVCQYFPERAAFHTLEALFPGPRVGASARLQQPANRRRQRPGSDPTAQRKRLVSKRGEVTRRGDADGGRPQKVQR